MGLEPLRIFPRPQPSVTPTRRGPAGALGAGVADTSHVGAGDGLSPAVCDGLSPAVRDGLSPAGRDGLSPAVRDGLSPAGRDGFSASALAGSRPGRLEAFQRGVERAADVITKGSGIVGGAMIGYEAVTVGIDVIPAALGATLTGGPLVQLAVRVGMGLDAVLGGTIGYKLASKVSKQAGRWGEKLSGRLGLTSKGGAAALKSTVAVARSAMVLGFAGFAIGHPILVPVLGVLGVGTALAASGAGHAVMQRGRE